MTIFEFDNGDAIVFRRAYDPDGNELDSFELFLVIDGFEHEAEKEGNYTEDEFHDVALKYAKKKNTKLIE